MIIVNYGLVIQFSSVNYKIDYNANENVDNFEEKDPIPKTADYTSNYNGTGNDVDIKLHQSLLNTSVIKFTNLTNLNTFKELCPADAYFNSSYTNITVDNIYAPDKYWEIETTTGNMRGIYNFDTTFGFQVKGDGNLDNFSICFTEDFNGGANGDADIQVQVRNAEWDNSQIEPGPSILYSTFDTVLNDTDAVWYNYTSLDISLDVSNTYNNYFFIWITQITSSGDARVRIHEQPDGAVNDVILMWDEAPWTEYNQDPCLTLGLSPLSNNPEPSQIGLEINGTAVINITSGKGFWSPSQSFGSDNGILNFDITANWWDVSCNITEVQINYTKTDLEATSEFTISKNEPYIEWLVNITQPIDNFDSNFEYPSINITIPDNWIPESIKVWNITNERTSDATNISLNNGYRDVIISNAGNGSWYLTANSTNRISSIKTYVGPDNMDIVDYLDDIEINVTITNNIEVSNGEFNLSVYNFDPPYNENYTNDITSFIAGTEINVDTWDISSDVDLIYGLFRVQVLWNNGTAAGFREKILTVLGETEISITPLHKLNYDSNEIFNITVLYNDTGQNMGIEYANINYSIDGGSWRHDNITYIGNGEYNITIDCSDSDFGGYGGKTIIINASKIFYNNQTDSVDIDIFAATEFQFIGSVSTNFDSGDIFNITIEYNDTVLNKGIFTNQVNYSIDGNDFRSDNIFYLGDGRYNITIKCNDSEFLNYGLKTIRINVNKTNYNNHSDTVNIMITGETELIIEEPFSGSMYSTTETFNITVYFRDVSRNDGIDGATIEYKLNDTANYRSTSWDDIGNGRYNITIDCNDVDFYPYDSYDITINASIVNYYNQSTPLNVIIIGNSSLSVVNPPSGSYYGPGDIFNVTIYYEDLIRNEGIKNVPLNNIKFKLESGAIVRSENATELGNGLYNITIYADHPDFTSYGPKEIEFNISKSYYHNTTATFNFNRQLSTTILPYDQLILPNIYRGDNTSFSFNYSDTNGKPILGANIQEVENSAGFTWFPIEQSDGNYTIKLNSSGVVAQVASYNFVFNISAIGNQTQEITLQITVLLPRTEIQSLTSNIANNIVPLGFNLTLNFNFTDIHKQPNQPITTLKTENVTVRQGITLWYSIVNESHGDVNFPNGGWLLIHNGNGNYTLKISTYLLTPGNLYSITIRIEYYSTNPGPYNYSETTLQFYYASSSVIIASDGGGGGGGGGTKVTGIPFETLVLYIIVIAAVVGTVAAIVGIQKGVIAPKKREKERILREVTTIFDDAINLEHILVIYKTSGTCVFFKSYGMEEIDPELISGFLSAVSSFGREMDSQEALNEIQYGDKMLLLADGEFIRVALVLNKQASIILRQHLKEFIDIYEEKYASSLPNWRGQLADFRDSGELIDRVFSTSIILPHQVNYDATKVKVLKSPHSKGVLKVANTLVNDSDRKYFFIATLLVEATDKTGKEKAEVFMGIKELRDTNILIPIEISAIEKPPITQQELDLIRQQICDLPGLSEEDIDDLANNLAQMGPAEREAYLASCREQAAVVSAPIKTKIGTAVIDSVKTAKKEIKNLKKLANAALKRKDTQRAIEIYNNAAVLATNWDLTKEFEEIEDVIRITTINELKGKLRVFESEAKVAAKAGDYNEATQKYSLASRAASEIFKLGITEMTKEVKRLTNKSKEYERLS